MFRPMTTVFALAALCTLLSVAMAAELTKDSLPTVKKNVDEEKAVLVDVRAKSEWDAGHIDGAIHLPITELEAGVDAEKLAARLPKDKIIYTHCVIGVRSFKAGNILEDLGYEVRPLKPGYRELLRAGFKKG